MFDRLTSLIGNENLDKIKKNRVIVFGIGGVGGYVVEMLVRSGIESLSIVDDDIVEKSNMNRQIIALNSTLGLKKVDVMESRIQDLNPFVKLDKISTRLTPENIASFNLEKYDFIVDAIDDVKAKVALIKYCLEKKLRIIVSTGTAKKLHPEYLSITTLDKTQNDPLARKLRGELKEYNTKKVTVLASTEKPLNIDKNTLGSSAFVPSTGGILIASHIINEIIK